VVPAGHGRESGLNGTELNIRACLGEIRERRTDADAIAKTAIKCADSCSEGEVLRIAMDLDELLSEAATLHGAMCLIGRMQRADARSG